MTIRRHRELVLAEVVERILRHPAEAGTIDDLAAHVGYTRRQLERIFCELLEESPQTFRTRIRMEMAWFLCAQRSARIGEIGQRVGYDSASGFTRAFQNWWGCSPRKANGPVPESRTGNPIRWVPEWASSEIDDRWAFRGFSLQLVRRPAMRLAKFTSVGSYSNLGDAWRNLHTKLIADGFDLRNRRCLTRYLDTLWTYPDRSNLKAHLLIELDEGERAPAGGNVVTISQRLCVQTEGYLRRSQRNDAWLQVLAAWRGYSMGMDEYGGSPVPWENVKTRICLVFAPNHQPALSH
ncbi:MAG: AraC family transcriptional regulator [Chthonomonas sp.]|nr:AraC family transcriptional regulator [Chthonomonas sp.]